MIRVIFLILLLAGNAYGARSVTVPFSESFDADITDVDWLVNGASETFMSSGGWSGGAKRVFPPTTTYGDGSNGGYGGMGTWDFTSTTAALNIRVLMRFGTTYAVKARVGTGNNQNKIIIVQGTGQRGILSLYSWDDAAIAESGKDFTFGPCNNATCKYENGAGTAAAGGDFFPTDANTFQLSEHLNEWICIEWELNLTTGVNRVYIDTADGTVAGLYKEYLIDTGGAFSEIQILGGYFNGYHATDANAYIEWDELQVSTSFIGPPAGFPSASPMGTKRSSIIIAER